MLFMDTMEERLRALATRHDKLAAISLGSLRALAREMGTMKAGAPCSMRQIEVAALQARVLPERYLRNLGTVGWEGQRRLLESAVAVVGVGGLGGWVVEGLARMGVGRLIAIDGDVFEENNLNRQALCTESTLGLPKVEVAQRRIAEVNSAVECVSHRIHASEDDLRELVAAADVIVDALDNLQTRLALQRVAQQLGIPLIHGAIAGYVGQIMTIFPGDKGLFALYGQEPIEERGVEVEWGNPTATPMMVAAWQIQEVVKVLLDVGAPLRNRVLFLDAESGTAEVMQLE